MPDKFDPYREALVMETLTVWPEEYEGWSESDKSKIAAAIHADPANASGLKYIRTHSGFCREITVTADDVARVQG